HATAASRFFRARSRPVAGLSGLHALFEPDAPAGISAHVVARQRARADGYLRRTLRARAQLRRGDRLVRGGRLRAPATVWSRAPWLQRVWDQETARPGDDGRVRVPSLDLKAQYAHIRADVQAAVQRVLESQRFILGPEVEAFERELAAYCGAAHAVGASSATDAP